MKTADQLDLQALHRVGSRLVGQRTAVINQIRGFLLEHGIAVRQGLRFLRQQLPDILAKRSDVLSPRMIRIMEDLSGDWRRLDERIEHITKEIEVLAGTDVNCGQLMTVPGIGPIVASATVAAIGNGAAFARGRDFAAWLGLVPKQMSTGDRTILGRITKRGNRYLRMLFVQGARAILLRPKSWVKHSFGPWLTTAARRLHRNILTIALSPKQSWRGSLCLSNDPRPQLRNAHRTGSRITWIANDNDLDSVIPAKVCELDGGDGETDSATSVIWWHIRPSKGLDANEIGCARISVMAGIFCSSSKGPNTDEQDQLSPGRHIRLATHGRSIQMCH